MLHSVKPVLQIGPFDSALVVTWHWQLLSVVALQLVLPPGREVAWQLLSESVLALHLVQDIPSFVA